jgi:SAM-dependent methyltransferase
MNSLKSEISKIELTPQFWRDYAATRQRSLARQRKKVATGGKWDRMAKHYHTFEEDEDFKAEQEWVIGRMQRRQMLAADLDIVDIACGPGTHCFAFAELCRQVTAVDVSEKMIARVLEKKQEKGVENLEVVCRDFYSFQPETTYDTVFVSMSPILNELESVDRLLGMSRRYLALVYWAGVRENPLFESCYRMIYNEDYRWDALDITVIFNYLNALGYSPEISYLHPVWKRRDTLDNTVEHIIWHLEFYRDLDADEKEQVRRLVAERVDEDDQGMVTYHTRVRKGALFLDLAAGQRKPAG